MGILDSITKKGSEISNSLQESMNKSQRESRCKKTINENNVKIEKAFSDIGKKIYEVKDVNEEVMIYITEQIGSIDKMRAENVELNKEILTLNNKKLCPNCHVEVDLNITFCPQCGQEQENIEVEVFIPKGKRKCVGCGEVIDDSNVFCPNCGTKKDDNNVVENAAKANSEPVSEVEVVAEEVTMEDASMEENVGEEGNAEVISEPEEVEVVEEVSNEPEVRKCSNCGEELGEEDVFCANCGTKN